MKEIKTTIKSFIYIILSILIMTFIPTALNYFNIINNNILNIINFIIILFSLALGGFVIGTNSAKNGWLKGLKIGIIFVIITLIFNLIFIHNINLKDLIFYFLLIISGIIGSMFGINYKTQK